MRRAGPRGRAAAAAARRAAATASPGCATAVGGRRSAVTDRGSKLSPTASPGSATAAVTDRSSKLSPSAAAAALLLLLLLAALAAPMPAAAQGPRPRPEWEKSVLHKYTLGAAGGWAEVDPTPGGCDKPQGPVCGPWRQEPIPWSAGKQKYAMKHANKHKVMKKWKVRIAWRAINRRDR